MQQGAIHVVNHCDGAAHEGAAAHHESMSDGWRTDDGVSGRSTLRGRPFGLPHHRMLGLNRAFRTSLHHGTALSADDLSGRSLHRVCVVTRAVVACERPEGRFAADRRPKPWPTTSSSACSPVKRSCRSSASATEWSRRLPNRQTMQVRLSWQASPSGGETVQVIFEGVDHRR